MKAGEWLYLCVAHGNDGAMEVRRVPPAWLALYVKTSCRRFETITSSFLTLVPLLTSLSSNVVPLTTSYTPWTVLPRC